jgi:hypothetical protein
MFRAYQVAAIAVAVLRPVAAERQALHQHGERWTNGERQHHRATEHRQPEERAAGDDPPVPAEAIGAQEAHGRGGEQRGGGHGEVVGAGEGQYFGRGADDQGGESGEPGIEHTAGQQVRRSHEEAIETGDDHEAVRDARAEDDLERHGDEWDERTVHRMLLDTPDQPGPTVVVQRVRVLDREGRVSGLIDEEREATPVTPVPPDV